MRRMRMAIAVSYFFGASVFAAPIDYSFTVDNLSQEFCAKVPGATIEDTTCDYQPVDYPVFSGPLTVSFTYDPEVTGVSAEEDGPGGVSYPDALTSISFTIDGRTFSPGYPLAASLFDATAIDPKPAFLPTDSLSFAGADLSFLPIYDLGSDSAIPLSIEYDGRPMRAFAAVVEFFNSAGGGDQFPDSALDDPLGPSSAMLPMDIDAAGFTDVYVGFFFNSRETIQLLDGSRTSAYNYRLVATQALVPVPAAAWLFASALMGLLVRRKYH